MQPQFIETALGLGKHVLSEKPIAKDVETAKSLLQVYKKSSTQVWSVGENLRFVDPVAAGFEALCGIGGEVVTFSVNLFAFVDENDKFYQTEW